MNRPHFQSSFEEYLKPILTKNSTPELELNRKSSDKTYNKSTEKKYINQKNVLSPEFDTYHWLDFQKPKPPEMRKLGYQFESLVTEVKHMKLPTPEWKIKIMVHKQEMISVSFSNKQTPEKVVTVNAKTSICDISIDNKKIILIGSPTVVTCIKDLEILLDIVHELDLKLDVNHSVIQYL